MSLETLLQDYGYLALFIGTFLEGETILIIAGFMAYTGQLDLHYCIGSALAGSFAGDQFAFYVGRWNSKWIMKRLCKWKSKVDKVQDLLKKHQNLLILSFRFFYGLRNVTPFSLGISHVHPFRYFIFNLMGAVVWAVSFGYAGYHLGSVATQFVSEDQLKHAQYYILGGVMSFFGLLWLLGKIRSSVIARRNGTSVCPDPDQLLAELSELPKAPDPVASLAGPVDLPAEPEQSPTEPAAPLKDSAKP